MFRSAPAPRRASRLAALHLRCHASTSARDRIRERRFGVTRSDSDPGPCSAWRADPRRREPGRRTSRRRRAPRWGRPAGRSRPRIETRSFAAVTYSDSRGRRSCPHAGSTPSRRRARRPPARRRHVHLVDTRARARRRGSRRPARGVITAIRAHARDLRGNRGHHERRRERRLPLGTQMPTDVDGTQRRSETIPGARLDRVSDGRCASLNVLTARDHPPQRFEHVVSTRAAAIRSALTRRPSGRGPSKRSVHSRSAASPRSRTSATIGARVAIASSSSRASHGTSRSTGRTRIEDAPAGLQRGQSVQTSSASTAA